MSYERVLCRLIGAIGLGSGFGWLLSRAIHPIVALVLFVVLTIFANIAEWRLDREALKKWR